MGLFDTIIIPDYKCPVCGKPLEEFQTKDLENLMNKYKVGDKISSNYNYIDVHTVCNYCKSFISGKLKIENGVITNEIFDIHIDYDSILYKEYIENKKSNLKISSIGTSRSELNIQIGDINELISIRKLLSFIMNNLYDNLILFDDENREYFVTSVIKLKLEINDNKTNKSNRKDETTKVILLSYDVEENNIKKYETNISEDIVNKLIDFIHENDISVRVIRKTNIIVMRKYEKVLFILVN